MKKRREKKEREKPFLVALALKSRKAQQQQHLMAADALAAFMVGDVLRFRRAQYSHLALYLGRGRVVHLWSPSASDFQVRMDTIRAVQHAANAETEPPECCTEELDARMLRDHALVPFGGDEAVHRALSRLGENEYDYLAHNCEHFVTWARYGERQSPQVATHSSQVLAGAMLGAVVGGMAGFFVGGLISLVTKADALSASVGGATASGGLGASVGSDFDLTHLSEDEDEGQDASGAGANAAARERLWAEVEVATATSRAASEAGLASNSELGRWVASRRSDAAAASARKYSDERDDVLAARLTEDRLQCGYELTTAGLG